MKGKNGIDLNVDFSDMLFSKIGIVEALNERGKQIDAVHFVHEFQLTESYPLASLLRTYLKDLRRNAQGKGSKLGNATGGQVLFLMTFLLPFSYSVFDCTSFP